MIDVRPFSTLGAAHHGWLDARHHFSFATHHRPDRMGWGALRVWNDDTIAAGHGFPMHPHRDMEIVTYVREGAISHRDSLGNEGRTQAGDVQVMSAGRGVSHAEFNAEAVATRLFQIWLVPDQPGGDPGWATRPFPKAAAAGGFQALASGLGDPGALPLRARARVLGVLLAPGDAVEHRFEEGRWGYAVLSRGAATVNAVALRERDGVAIRDEPVVRFVASQPSEIVLVECEGDRAPTG